MKNLFLLIWIAFAFSSCSKDEQPENQGIDGIIWATANVGEPGKFVAKPEDRGNLYDFDEAQTVCPDGWRLPTLEEFDKLVSAGSEWETRGEMDGVRFGNEDYTVFLPAAGFRSKPDDEEIFYKTGGRYWSSVAYSDREGGGLAFDQRPPGWEGFSLTVSKENGTYFPYKENKFSVRCVKE
jgi:uncharacterized protein (TIGR02145 family)